MTENVRPSSNPNHSEIMARIDILENDQSHEFDKINDRLNRGDAILKMFDEFKNEISQKFVQLESKVDAVLSIWQSKWFVVACVIAVIVTMLAGGALTMFAMIKLNWFEQLAAAKNVIGN